MMDLGRLRISDWKVSRSGDDGPFKYILFISIYWFFNTKLNVTESRLSNGPSYILERDTKLDWIIRFILMLVQSAYRSISKLKIRSEQRRQWLKWTPQPISCLECWCLVHHQPDVQAHMRATAAKEFLLVIQLSKWKIVSPLSQLPTNSKLVKLAFKVSSVCNNRPSWAKLRCFGWI